MSSGKISRRALLAAGAAAALGVPAQAARAQGRRARPNILWLVSEDNSPFIGAYGDRLARTPAIDALAAEGILYTNAFATAPVCAPSRFGIITGIYAESCGPAHNMRARGRVPAFLRGFPQYLREAGYYCTNNEKTDYNAPVDVQATWNESSGEAHWRHRPAGAPFFAVFNFMDNHEINLFGVTEGRVRPEDVRVPAHLPDVPDVRRDIASYYNLMERMDRLVAARLAELEEAGLAEDTIVFYYSDHGGALPRSKRYCYDEGLRVPLVVRVPAKWAHLARAQAGSIVSSPVSLVDLAPTVLALAGVPRPRYMQGGPFMGVLRPHRRSYAFGMRNRMDERYDMVRTLRDEKFRYVRNYSPHRIHGQHVAFAWQARAYQAWESGHRAGTLDGIQERFWREKPAEELYDLTADPDQVSNLIDAPEHRARIAAMRNALDEHMLRIVDNGFIPEGAPMEGYDASRAPGAYPLRRVMHIAGEAIRRDPRNVARFVIDLLDGNEVVRYWAAQGLLMLRTEAAPAHAALESCLDGDPSVHVRIVAAEALALLGEPAPSMTALGEILASHRDARVRLQALNALTFIGEPARDALPVIERAEKDEDQYVQNAARYLGLVLRGSYTPASQVFAWPAARSQ